MEPTQPTQLTDILRQTGGLRAMARQLGVSESEAATGAEALLPAILGGFKRQVQAHPAGLDGLGGLLDQLGGSAMHDEVLAPEPTDPGRGEEVLGQIFGSREVSRTVAQHASTQSGLDASLLKQMLPLLAMLVTGFMARQHGGASASPDAPAGGIDLGGLLGSLLGGGGAAGGMPAGGAASGLGALLDLNGDGNPLDDVMRMAGAALR
jgi:hypothetical protein